MNVLCIDDDADDFSLLQEAVHLCNMQCACFHAPNGCEALLALKTLRPDLIFLDNNMPIMTGYETLQHIRMDNSYHAIPIYLLSTCVRPDERECFMKLGVIDCLVKPHTFDDLCMLVKTVLQNHSRNATV